MNELWMRPLACDPIRQGQLVLRDGILLELQLAGGRLAAFDPATGAERWSVDLHGSVGSSSIIALDGSLVAASVDRGEELHVVRVSLDGRVAGDDHVGRRYLDGPLWLHADGRGDYAVGYHVDNDYMVEVRTSSGRVRWKGNGELLGAGAGVVIVRDRYRGVEARLRGERSWIRERLGWGKVAGAVYVVEDAFDYNEWAEDIDADGDGPSSSIAAISLADGQHVWSRSFPAPPLLGNWVSNGDSIFIAHAARLHRLELATGRELAVAALAPGATLHAIDGDRLVWATPSQLHGTTTGRLDDRAWSIDRAETWYRIQAGDGIVLCHGGDTMHAFAPDFEGTSTRPARQRPADDREVEVALFRRIREAPDDLAARMVYADWLEVRGDARSEMIRIARDRSPRAQRRFKELQSANYRAWAAALPQWAKRPSYHAGFLSWIVVDDLATVLAHRAEIVAMMPIPHVELEGDQGSVTFSLDDQLVLHHAVRRNRAEHVRQSGSDVFTVYAGTRVIWSHEQPYAFVDDGDRLLSSTDRANAKLGSDSRSIVLTFYRAGDNGPPSPEHATPQVMMLPS